MRFFFLLILVLSNTAKAEDAPHCTINTIEKSLQKIRSLKANFVQKNSDKTTFKGTFTLKRPGKLKFSYDNPKGMVILSDGESLIYFDPHAHQATYLSLENSPASLLLDDPLDFRKHASILSLEEKDQVTIVGLKTHKTQHLVSLFFDKKREVITGWKTKDPQGNIVEIQLDKIDVNPNCGEETFKFKKPKRSRKR